MPNDFRTALRSLLRSPGFVITAVLSLALAIGASVAAFSVVDAVRFRAMPFPDAERLVVLGETDATPGAAAEPCRGGCSVAYETYARVLGDYPFRSLDAIAAFTSGAKALARGGEMVIVSGGVVSPNIFELLRARPILGRGLNADDDRLGVPLVTVLSHEMWETHFGKSPAVLGTDVKLSDSHYTVVGVMPPGFRFEVGSQFWLPAVPTLDPSTRPSIRSVTVMGRLAPGATIEQLRAEVAGIEPPPVSGTRRNAARMRLVADPLRERYVSSTRSHDVMFAAIVACVLLIACANLANLVLARTLHRQREFAIRAALGAGGRRLARSVVVQNAIIVAAASLLGLMLASSALGVLRSLPVLDSVRPDGMDYRLDARAAAFAVLVAAVAATLVSIVPARLLIRRDVQHLLREGAPSGGGEGARWTQRVFVIAQVGCATVLLIGGGLMAKTVLHFSRVDVGFDAAKVVSGTPSFPHPWRVPERYMPVTERILGDLARLPGVAAVTLRASVPIPQRDGAAGIAVDGRPEPLPSALVPRASLSVSPGYFAALGVPVLSGREFVDRDHERGAPVAIVNAWAARRWWPDRDAVGQIVRVDTGGASAALTVVGVVADNKAARQNLLLADDGPELYRPFRQASSAFPTFLVRAAGDAGSLLRPMRDVLTRLVPDRPLFASLVSERVREQLGGVRSNAMQILGFAVVGLLLAVIGVYGVLTFDVSRRTREIGIRGALGASRARIARMTLFDATKLTVIGMAIGLPMGMFATRIIADLLHSTSPTDPVVYASVVVCIALISLVAAYVPARRAARVDPIIALKSTEA